VAKKLKIFSLCAVSLAYAALLLLRPAAGAEALRGGLSVCAERLIPSLLPFMILSDFILRSGAAEAIGIALSPLSRRLFRLPGVCAPVIFMSLTGGYPVGISLTASLAAKGRISAANARRMTRFCFGAGPAFTVLGVGRSLFGSLKAGWLLFAAVALSALIIGLISPGKTEPSPKKMIRPPLNAEFQSPSAALAEAVRVSSLQMLQICAWTLLFASLCAYLRLFAPTEAVAGVGAIFLEVTAGTRAASSLGSLPVIAAALGWGGLCVYFQLYAHLRQSGQSFARFALWRLVHAALAALICAALLTVFPVELTEMAVSVSALPSARLWRLSAPAAAGLAAMGIGLLLRIQAPESKNKSFT
jgi:sporulation integral membrane protein YlbJ